MSSEKPVLYVFFGLIASGKSTLAAAWAEKLAISYFNSDVVRKQLAGIDPSSRAADDFGAGIYSTDFSRRTYDGLLAAAAGELRAGRSVVLDASYGQKKERDRVRILAASLKAAARFILCRCQEEETRRRLALRATDPKAVSDGRLEIYLQQKKSFDSPDELTADELIIVDTADTPERLVKRLEELCNIG